MTWLTVLRDILIIVVAVESLVAIGFLVYLGFQILALVRTLQGQVPPIFETAKHTTSTVQGTMAFVSRHAVEPVIRGASLFAAATRFLQVLLRGSGSRRP